MSLLSFLQSKNIGWLLIGLGIFLLLIVLALLFAPPLGSESAEEVAVVSEVSGDVQLIRNHQAPNPLSAGSSLFSGDRILTGSSSLARVKTTTEAQIRLEGGTDVLLELQSDQGTLEIFRRQGSLTIEDPGLTDSVFIRDGAEIYRLKDYAKEARPGRLPPLKLSRPSTQTEASADPSTELAEDDLAPDGPVVDLSQTPEEQIYAELHAQRGSLYRCFGQLIQRSPGSKGRVQMRFRLEETGRVSRAEIIDSSIEDDTFSRCLVEALRRVQFRHYQGPETEIVFPLRFD